MEGNFWGPLIGQWSVERLSYIYLLHLGFSTTEGGANTNQAVQADLNLIIQE